MAMRFRASRDKTIGMQNLMDEKNAVETHRAHAPHQLIANR